MTDFDFLYNYYSKSITDPILFPFKYYRHIFILKLKIVEINAGRQTEKENTEIALAKQREDIKNVLKQISDNEFSFVDCGTRRLFAHTLLNLNNNKACH